MYLYSVHVYTYCIYKGDSKLGVYTVEFFSTQKPLFISQTLGCFCCSEQEELEGAELIGVPNREAGDKGLGSRPHPKPLCNVWSAWCVTHRINKAANLHFCLCKLLSTPDSLFWQGYRLASALLPSNVFKHWMLWGKLRVLPASEDHAFETANIAQAL